MQTSVTSIQQGQELTCLSVNVYFNTQEWEELKHIKQEHQQTREKAIKAAVEHFLLWG